MSRTPQVDGQNLSNPEKSSFTTIRRTIVERGVRSVDNDSNYLNGQSSTLAAITNINKQHEDEQRELQELNSKLSSYLDHVQQLENRNAGLTAAINDLKQQWGGDADQVRATFGPQLQTLRDALDSSLRDQIYPELQIKRHEYGILQTQQLITAFDGGNTHRLNTIQQELNMAVQQLEDLKNQVDRRSGDLTRQRTNLENLFNELDGLQNELTNSRLERIMVENELQTLREQMSFEDAIHQAQREELLSLATPAIDISQFYRNELARAISDIRQDFDVLSQSQLNELEEYYRIKTEHIQQELAQENQRRLQLNTDNETTDRSLKSSSFADLKAEYKQLHNDNNQLQARLDDISEDLARIREEHLREQERQDREMNQIREEVALKQEAIDGILGNNVSLRFELTTYSRLLNSEEQRLSRIEQEQQGSTSTSSSSYSNSINTIPRNTNIALQKMAVKKSTQGPIAFDSVDFVNDCVTIIYDASSGNEQSLGNWTIRHENDRQSPKVFKFPTSFALRPRQLVRILSRRSPQSMRSGSDTLFAADIDTWGQGQVMVTRLLDTNNTEKASITQTRVPA